MTTTTRTIAERVAAGAAALDAEMPGWVDRVDLATLDMRSHCNCILGQTFLDYFDAPFGDECDSPERRKADLGFQSLLFAAAWDAPGSVAADRAARAAEYGELQAEWTRLIEARRAEAGAS